jgi:glucuronate isomerase
VKEHFITGEASAFEKFEKFCEIFPLLAGNPVFDWARMELSQIFGITCLPSKETARGIFDQTREMLRGADFSTNAILSRFPIAYQSPVAPLLGDLTDFGTYHTAPSLRGDELLSPTPAFMAELGKKSGVSVCDEASYLKAVCVMLDRFVAADCCFVDHALDHDFFEKDTDGRAQALLRSLCVEYAKRGFTLLLHLDAKRDASKRLFDIAGQAGGYAAVGGDFPVARLCALLDQAEQAGGLPDTVLFPLNIGDQAPLAVMQGSFSEDGVAAKVQLGPAWWWCDHEMGIENTLQSISSFGVLSQFIGMTTDSRSILSFVRHDYFRRILCSYIADKDWGLPLAMKGEIVEKICYKNAFDKINKRREKKYEIL